MRKLWLLLLVLLLTGCGQLTATYAPSDLELAQQMEDYAQERKGVTDAQVVIVDKYMVVALTISPWQRYRKAKIEESLTKYWEKRHPDFELVVSADRKLQIELAKMKYENKDDVKKDVKRLQALLKEET